MIQKLSHSSAQIRDRAELVSAATLGTGRARKEAERINKMHALHDTKRPRGAAFRVEEDDQDEDLDQAQDEQTTSGSDSDETPVPVVVANDVRQERIEQAARRFDQSSAAGPVAVGSALATGADGKPVMPVTRKRQRSSNQGKSNLSWRDRRRGASRAAETPSGTDSSASDSSESDAASDAEEGVHVYDVDKAIAASRASVAASREWKPPSEPTDLHSDSSVDTDDLSSEEGETDEEEEAVLLHAMRLRGMAPDTQDAVEGSDEGSEEGEEGEESGEGSEEGEESDEDSDEETEDERASEDASGAAASESLSQRWGIGESSRSKGFKQWAMEALHLLRPEADASAEGRPLEPVGGRVDRVSDLGPQDGKVRGPLGRDMASPATRSSFTKQFFDEEAIFQKGKGPVRHVSVQRTDAVEAARLALPVVAEEDAIMRTINENPVTVLCGETGSGKTTQVPQFLYEAAYASSGSGRSSVTNPANPGLIGITQPRRVAAVSMAKRVAHELNVGENRVAHQIRYDATVGPHTQIKFMTDGVLLRELAQDLLLTKYSVVIVDEAHERSVNTDVLIGMLSRVVRLREQRWASGGKGLEAPRPLRLVIMSATLRVSDFTQNTTLFATPPPVIEIGARQHPVSIHFNRKTTQDYVTEAIKKTSKIHARLPLGGILVFVTGQQEVATVCRKLQQTYGADALARKQVSRRPPPERSVPSARVADVEAEEVELGTTELQASVDESGLEEDPEALDSDEEGAEEELEPAARPMHILPLYSLLPTAEQQRVFDDPPENTRLVVVATNVAETSITIPNIKYVVDCGRVKERHIEQRSQVQSYDIAWISKASALQRAGRAGRTGPGHCYRLYSSAVYEEVFASFGVPEILRTPVEGLVLQMKAMNIDNVANFPFPTPPDRHALVSAERMLIHLGALERSEVRETNGRRAMHASVTELGRVMALFPVVPRFAKLLAQGNQHGCLPYAVALVAALSVGDVFEREDAAQEPSTDELDSAEAKEARRIARAGYYAALRVFDALGEAQSDAFRLLSVVGAYAHEAAKGSSLRFCQSHYVRPKAMEEIHKLRAQLSQILLANLGGVSEKETQDVLDPGLAPPSTNQCKVLRQLLTAIYIDRVAVRADVVGAPEAEGTPAERGKKVASTRGVPYVALGVAGPVYIHGSSIFFHKTPPEWVVFGELHQSASKEAVVEGVEAPAPKVWLKMLTRINPAWLPKLGPTLCTYSQPTEAEPSSMLSKLAGTMKSLREGTASVPEREVLLTPRYGGAMEDGGAGQGLGWELPAITARQRYEHGRWTTQR